jgi:hypothetical protein
MSPSIAEPRGDFGIAAGISIARFAFLSSTSTPRTRSVNHPAASRDSPGTGRPGRLPSRCTFGQPLPGDSRAGRNAQTDRAAVHSVDVMPYIIAARGGRRPVAAKISN